MKVVICDDQAIVRDGLEMLLKLEPDVEVGPDHVNRHLIIAGAPL